MLLFLLLKFKVYDILCVRLGHLCSIYIEEKSIFLGFFEGETKFNFMIVPLMPIDGYLFHNISHKS